MSDLPVSDLSPADPPEPGADVEVLIPARDEAVTIASVVRGMRRALPAARIVVYDDASTDATAFRAREAGAEVRRVSFAGKGAVVRAMFAAARAPIVLLCDGDGTYPCERAPALVAALRERALHMVTGARVAAPGAPPPWPPGHVLGNRLIAGALRLLLGVRSTDPLTGYRALTLAFARAFPARSYGFTVETELEICAVLAGARTGALPVAYAARPPGSRSKLRMVRDGAAIGAFIACAALAHRAPALALPLIALALCAALVWPELALPGVGFAGGAGAVAAVLEWRSRASRRALARALHPSAPR